MFTPTGIALDIIFAVLCCVAEPPGGVAAKLSVQLVMAKSGQFVHENSATPLVPRLRVAITCSLTSHPTWSVKTNNLNTTGVIPRPAPLLLSCS